MHVVIEAPFKCFLLIACCSCSVQAASARDQPEPTISDAAIRAALETADCKIVDFGNACWIEKQFTADIQTRQYRCPEVSF